MKVLESFLILIFCFGAANGLRCYKCVNRIGNCTAAQVEVCRPLEDICFTEIKDYYGLRSHTVKRGCGTANYCRRYKEGLKGLLRRTLYCCASELCEPISVSEHVIGSENGLRCQTCIGNADECGHNAPSEPCYDANDRCVQISQRFLPGEEMEPIIKGCGPREIQDKLVAYQIGKDFAYVDQKSCALPNCNNRSFQDILPGQPNGLQCYTCKERGDGECALDRLHILNCTGEMNRCLHVMDKYNRTVTIHKGCATESMCSNFVSIYFNLIRQDSIPECCKKSLCNQAAGSSCREMIVWLVALLCLAWLA